MAGTPAPGAHSPVGHRQGRGTPPLCLHPAKPCGTSGSSSIWDVRRVHMDMTPGCKLPGWGTDVFIEATQESVMRAVSAAVGETRVSGPGLLGERRASSTLRSTGHGVRRASRFGHPSHGGAECPTSRGSRANLLF